jgi:ATP phosphoribosyltransferase
MLRVAICKGGLFPPTVDLLEKAGYETGIFDSIGRRLRIDSPIDKLEFIICRPTDIPTYVEYGAADIGVVGKDVLMESEKNIFELLDLSFGRCELVLAEPLGEKVFDEKQIRIATKYPNVAQKYFSGLGLQMEIVKLHGNIELAPSVGLAEQIVDIVSTGRTLRDNKLAVVDRIAVCTARMVSNRVSQRLKFSEIMDMKERLSNALGGANA